MKYKSGCAKAIKMSLDLGLPLKSNLNFPTKHKILRKIKAKVKPIKNGNSNLKIKLMISTK